METEVSFRTNLGDTWNISGSYFIKSDSTSEDIQEIVLHVLHVLNKIDVKLIFTLNSYPLQTTLQE